MACLTEVVATGSNRLLLSTVTQDCLCVEACSSEGVISESTRTLLPMSRKPCSQSPWVKRDLALTAYVAICCAATLFVQDFQ